MHTHTWKRTGWDNRFNFTHGVGAVDESYDRLIEVFGPPNPETDGYKIDAEWTLVFMTEDPADEVVATIYNYKDGPNYLGPEGTPVKEIRDWHIGGHTTQALDLVRKALA